MAFSSQMCLCSFIRKYGKQKFPWHLLFIIHNIDILYVFSSWLSQYTTGDTSGNSAAALVVLSHDDTGVDSECLDPAQICKCTYLHATQPLQLCPQTFSSSPLSAWECWKHIFTLKFDRDKIEPPGRWSWNCWEVQSNFFDD